VRGKCTGINWPDTGSEERSGNGENCKLKTFIIILLTHKEILYEIPKGRTNLGDLDREVRAKIK
jgi:hypothetical protein